MYLPLCCWLRKEMVEVIKVSEARRRNVGLQRETEPRVRVIRPSDGRVAEAARRFARCFHAS